MNMMMAVENGIDVGAIATSGMQLGLYEKSKEISQLHHEIATVTQSPYFYGASVSFTHIASWVIQMREHLVAVAAKPAQLEDEVTRLRQSLSLRTAELHSLRLQLRVYFNIDDALTTP
jgi:hypothetical protein